MPTHYAQSRTDERYNMTTIGLIGAGHIGATLARIALDAGYEVVLSNSREPETLNALVAALGRNARAGTPAEAAAAGDLVVVTVPLKAYRDVPVVPLRGKTVIDTNNYYPERDGRIPVLEDESTTTSELLQSHLPESHVVKAFNNIYYLHLGRLGRPLDDPRRPTLPIAGNSLRAKQAVSAFIDALGYEALDVGPLAEGWRFQRDLPAYSLPYAVPGNSHVDENSEDQLLHNASPDQLRAALARAKRYRDF